VRKYGDLRNQLRRLPYFGLGLGAWVKGYGAGGKGKKYREKTVVFEMKFLLFKSKIIFWMLY
jgi:hypothetical protein